MNTNRNNNRTTDAIDMLLRLSPKELAFVRRQMAANRPVQKAASAGGLNMVWMG